MSAVLCCKTHGIQGSVCCVMCDRQHTLLLGMNSPVVCVVLDWTLTPAPRPAQQPVGPCCCSSLVHHPSSCRCARGAAAWTCNHQNISSFSPTPESDR